MAFGVTPVDTSAPPIPMSSVVPDGTGTPAALEGGPVYSSDATGNKAPASIYVKDGNDLAQGTTTDAAVVNPASAASVIALLKGLLTELIDIEAQTILPAALGQTTMAASLPVTIANNQGAIGSVVYQATAGTALTADQTGTVQRVSIAGSNSTAGDALVAVNASGYVKVVGQANVGTNIGNVGMVGATYLNVAGTSTDVTVKAGAGVYYGAKVTVLGATAAVIEDGSSTIDQFAASAAVGFESVVPSVGIKCTTSVVVKGGAANPSLIVYFI
jgi:hypothetical protein